MTNRNTTRRAGLMLALAALIATATMAWIPAEASADHILTVGCGPDGSGNVVYACSYVDSGSTNQTAVYYPQSVGTTWQSPGCVQGICPNAPYPYVTYGSTYEPGASSYGKVRVGTTSESYSTDNIVIACAGAGGSGATTPTLCNVSPVEPAALGSAGSVSLWAIVCDLACVPPPSLLA